MLPLCCLQGAVVASLGGDPVTLREQEIAAHPMEVRLVAPLVSDREDMLNVAEAAERLF